MDVVIRLGTKEDVPALLQLINELAIYEKAPDEVVISVDNLLRDGFGENPLFGFFVAEVMGDVVGAALYYFKYSTWKGKCLYLEDLIVKEEKRCQGIGGKLFQRVAQKAKDEQVGRLEWQVLDWNAPAIAFYQKLGAEISSEWLNGRMIFGSTI